MNTNDHHSHSFSHLKDGVVFLITVATCTLLITAACTFSKTADTVLVPLPLMTLAMPQPPGPLELAAEPESISPVVDVSTALPPPVLPEITVTQKTVVPNESIPFHGIIVQVAGRYEVDPHLIRAIILAESGYNPKAKSKKGARGLMQLMPATARALGVQDIYDPEENIDGGVRYFRSLLDRFDGDVQLALAAYNAGSRHVRNYEGIPPFKATQRYIKKVLRFHEKFKTEQSSESRRVA
jgi:soluble lytic murein transglycosylase-like protein